MRILVTGAAGFAGRYLLEYLLQGTGPRTLYGLARDLPDWEPSEPRVHWLIADLTNAAAAEEAVRASDPDVIYHLAGHAAAVGERREVFRANVDAAFHVLRAAARLGHPVRVMLASSGAVYGACEEGQPATEETPLRPVGTYAESKVEMERGALGQEWGERVSLVIARAFNHTGPRQTTQFAVPAFARQLAAIEAGLAEPVLRVGNLESRRDLGDVRDVVRAYVALTAAGRHGERFNVCTGRLVRIRDVLDELVSMCGRPVTVIPDPERIRPLDVAINYGSARKLEARTGWRPEIALPRTLRDTLDWWRRDVRRC